MSNNSVTGVVYDTEADGSPFSLVIGRYACEGRHARVERAFVAPCQDNETSTPLFIKQRGREATRDPCADDEHPHRASLSNAAMFPSHILADEDSQSWHVVVSATVLDVRNWPLADGRIGFLAHRAHRKRPIARY